MWSYPSYDPNLIANPDYDAAFAALTELQADPRDPLLANAYQQRYMPGSVFKVFTTSVALDDGVVNLESFFPDESQYVPPQTTDPVENYGGSTCGGDLATVFARSCNTPFARTAVDLGPERFIAGTARWGFGEPIPIDLPRPVASTIGDTSNLAENLPLLAIRGFGQNEDQLVPIHMAMAAAAVANGGVMMKPYVVDAELDHQGRVLKRTQPEAWKTPITPGTAAIMKDLMIGVALRGTASCCIALEGGIPVAAKTGTAQLNAAGEPAGLAPLDHRVRARRCAEVRRRRDAQGHQRGDLSRHRRAGGGADRQGDARRGVRRRRGGRCCRRPPNRLPSTTGGSTPDSTAVTGGRSGRMRADAVTVNLGSRSITSDNVPRSTSSTRMGWGRQNQ